MTYTHCVIILCITFIMKKKCPLFKSYRASLYLVTYCKFYLGDIKLHRGAERRSSEAGSGLTSRTELSRTHAESGQLDIRQNSRRFLTPHC